MTLFCEVSVVFDSVNISGQSNNVQFKTETQTEETELEMLTRRNEFLREEEKRLADRLEKLQQNYLSLIKQKKSDFSSIQ